MRYGRWEPRRNFRRAAVAFLLATGGVLCIWSAQAFATGRLVLSKSTDLIQRETVFVAGSGFAHNAYGYVLECNAAPGEPTDLVGPPFNMVIPVGCSAPSLKHIVHTSATGTLSTKFVVHVSRRLGPPCSIYSVFGGCGHPDSAGGRPRHDAQNYPCPPSPRQQAAGVTCQLRFYDSAREIVATPISFRGANYVPPPPTTAPPQPIVTPSPTSSPTSTPLPPNPVAPGGGGSPGTGGSGSSGSGSSGSVGGAGTGVTGALTGSAGSGASGVSSGSLAFTGLGPGGETLAVMGGLLLLTGLVLFFVNVRRVMLWFLGYRLV